MPIDGLPPPLLLLISAWYCVQPDCPHATIRGPLAWGYKPYMSTHVCRGRMVRGRPFGTFVVPNQHECTTIVPNLQQCTTMVPHLQHYSAVVLDLQSWAHPQIFVLLLEVREDSFLGSMWAWEGRGRGPEHWTHAGAPTPPPPPPPHLHLTSTSPHLTSPRLASPRLASPHLTSPHLTSPHLTSPHLTSPHLTSPRLTSPRLASPCPHHTQQICTIGCGRGLRCALWPAVGDLIATSVAMRSPTAGHKARLNPPATSPAPRH